MGKGSKFVDDVAREADEVVATASAKARDTAGHVGDEAADVVGKASHAADRLKDEAADLASTAGSKLKDAAATGKDMAADAVHGLAGAARDMAGKLDDGDADGAGARVAGYARKAADGMDRFSDGLKGKELDEIADDARRAVRDHPAIAVGAAAIIGFALARFLKSGSGSDRNA